MRQVSNLAGGLNGSSQHSRKACLQEFHNATFFEGIELTAWPFKRAKNQPFSLQRTRKVRTEPTKPPVYKEFPDRIVLHRPVEAARLYRGLAGQPASGSERQQNVALPAISALNSTYSGLEIITLWN